MIKSHSYSANPDSKFGEQGKIRLGVFKFASCDGCQLAVLDCQGLLMDLLGAVEIKYFPEATSKSEDKGIFDLTLVEGSISTPEQLHELRSVRARSRFLVSIGACATSGGIQALRNFADHDEYRQTVYAHPEYISSLATSTPVSKHVKVDFELRGCPISEAQLVEVITALLVGRRPVTPEESVCMDCKRNGTICVMVAKGLPCLGPVTHTGCNALCPGYGRGCFGCYGPQENANPEALGEQFRKIGLSEAEILRQFRMITGYAEAFRKESKKHERVH